MPAHAPHPPHSPFEPDPRLFPFRSRFFESRVGPVHYIDEGVGPTLLFLHGNPTWSFLYRGIVIRLRDRFRCIALDYPGFGLSAHPEDYGYTPAEHAGVVRDFVRHMELEKLTIMGQDWGGPIGMRVALDEPHRMRGLVMGNTWYWPTEALHLRAFGRLLSTGFVQGLILRKNLMVERVMPRGVLHELAPEVMEQYRLPFPDAQSRAGAAELPRQIERSRRWLLQIANDVPSTLGHLPLLLAWGVHDFAFTPTNIDRFREDFERVRVVRLEAKHFIQEDAPGEISQAIGRFMDAMETADRG
jgi:haloalkane dehalogenase